MAGEVSTLGVSISYGSAAANARPTAAAGYTVTLPNVKSISAINSEPSQIDVTDLSATQYRAYILGLIDAGGSVTLTANNTDAFQTAWSTLVSALATAKASSKVIWFCVQFPGLANAFYFYGEPSALGMNDINVDEAAEVDAYISLQFVHGWAAKPTTN